MPYGDDRVNIPPPNANVPFPSVPNPFPNTFPPGPYPYQQPPLSAPICTEVEITVRAAGKVQIVQFKLSNDFEVAYSERYTIPADWDEERREEWKRTKTEAIKAKVEEYAQREQDALLEASDWYTP